MIAAIVTSSPICHAAVGAVLVLASYAFVTALITDAVTSRPFFRVTVFAVLLFAAYAQMAASLRAESADSAMAPEAVIRDLASGAIRVLSDDGLEPRVRVARFRELLAEYFDLERIGRFALGKHWNSATDAERGEYRRLFEDYVLSFYVARLENYSGETLKIGSAKMSGGDNAVVGSEVQAPSGNSMRVDWHLRRSGGRWHVVDLVVEGISLSITQRSEFDSVIRSSGGRIEGLLAKLREFNA